MAKKNFMLYGMDWRIFTIFGGAILISAYMNIIPNQLIGGIAVMFTLGIIFGELGEQLPIWNKYCGGGAILAFLACGILTYTNLMPKNIVSISKGWMSTYSFLNVFISTLVVGSLLGLDRKLLIKSGALYLPALLASLAVAALFGILGGLLFGIKPAEVVTAYVLPIMAGLACGEPCSIGWQVLSDYADFFISCPDYAAAQGMRILGNPMGKDQKVVSGESGAAAFGAVSEILRNPELKELKEALNLNENSRILFFSTEGDTDKENYRRIVWDGLYAK